MVDVAPPPSTAEVEPNNTIPTANLMAAGIAIQGKFHLSNDSDYYRLSLASQQEVTVSLSTTSRRGGSSPLEIVADIINDSDDSMGRITSPGSDEVSTKIVAGPGDIYIRVKLNRNTYGVNTSLTYLLKGDALAVAMPEIEIYSLKLNFGSKQIGFSEL